MPNTEEFAAWLRDELHKRRWNLAEVARRSGVNLSHLTRVISGERGLSAETARKLARALQLPPEDLFRKAGLLPRARHQLFGEAELHYLYEQLSDRNRHQLLVIARALLTDETREETPHDDKR